MGFQELPAFQKPENYLKAAEMSMEDDYGMIDGIINNGPKLPTVADLEAQVKKSEILSKERKVPDFGKQEETLKETENPQLRILRYAARS